MPSERVKLETRQLDKIIHMFGKQGLVLSPGLYNKKEVKKGYKLEYGDARNNQVARPWLSSIFLPKTVTREKIEDKIVELIQDALQGNDTSIKIGNDIATIVQDHVLDKQFQAPPLKRITIIRKKIKGYTSPSSIGLATFSMVSSIKTKISGGKKNR